jgi:hypothetical protein
VAKKLLAWDTLAIIEGEVESRRESGEYPHLSDAELFRKVCEDHDLFRFHWRDLCGALTEMMEQRNPNGWWYAEMENFGWRKLDGHKAFRAGTGEKLLRQILPDTECTFHVYDYAGGRGFAINNFHHDSPVGKEWYYVELLDHAECPDCGQEFLHDAGERAFIGEHGLCSRCYEYNRVYAEHEEPDLS